MSSWPEQTREMGGRDQEMMRKRQLLLSNTWRAILIPGTLSIVAALYLDYSSWQNGGQYTHIISAMIYLFVWGWIVIMQFWREAPYRLQAYSLLGITYGVGVMLLSKYGMEGDGRILLLLVPFVALVFLDRKSGLLAFWVSLLTVAVFALAWTTGVMPPPFREASDVMTPAGWVSSGVTWLLISVFVYLTLQALLGWYAGALAVSRQQAVSLEKERTQMSQLVAQTQYHAALLEKSVVLMQRLLSLRRYQELGEVLVSELAAEWHLGRVRLFTLASQGKVLTLLAEAGESEVLQSQEAARIMVGSDSLPGQASFDGLEHVLSWNAGERPEYPEGYVEVSFPLIVRGDMLGVLDICSMRPSFSEVDMQIFRIIAGYTATSLDMARLWETSESQIQRLRSLYSHQVEEAWASLLETEGEYQFIVGDVPVEQIGDLVHSAIESGGAESALLPDGSRYVLVVPIQARSTTVGYLAFTRPAEQGNWPQTTISLVRVAAERLGIILDNIRLLLESRRQAFYEERLGQISDVVWSTLSVDAIMQQSVQELGRLLEASEVTLFVSSNAEYESEGSRS